MNRKEIGQLIRKTRGKLGQTQGMLAEKAGVTQSAISMMERGKPDAMSDGNLVQVGKALELDLLPMLEEADNRRDVLKYCSDPACLSNLPVETDGGLILRPVMVEAPEDELTRCRFCGLPLERNCAHCQSQVYDSAVCLTADCGAPYVEPPEVEDTVLEIERRYRKVRAFFDTQDEIARYQAQASERDHQRKGINLPRNKQDGVSENDTDIGNTERAASGTDGAT